MILYKFKIIGIKDEIHVPTGSLVGFQQVLKKLLMFSLDLNSSRVK